MNTTSHPVTVPTGWHLLPAPDELDAEDGKLVVLARGAMARAEAGEGAAVRDVDGRTYAAAPVALTSLRLSALQVAVATAASSGAAGLEAAVIVGGEAGDPGLSAAADLSGGVTVIITDRAGRERRRLARTGANA